MIPPIVILHNSFDRASREFVRRYGSDAVVYDWYCGGRELWLKMGGTSKISAFPSVVFVSGSQQRVVRQPASLDAARDAFLGSSASLDVAPRSLNQIEGKAEAS